MEVVAIFFAGGGRLDGCGFSHPVPALSGETRLPVKTVLSLGSWRAMAAFSRRYLVEDIATAASVDLLALLWVKTYTRSF